MISIKYLFSRVIRIFRNIFIIFLGTIVLYVLLIKADRFFGRDNSVKVGDKSLKYSYVSISKGDIIFKVSSFLFANSQYPSLGCIPGHLAICLTDTIMPINKVDFKNIIVAESSLFNLKEKKLDPSTKINSSDNNFGYASGRLFLLKNSLNAEQVKKLYEFTAYRNGIPYKLFAGKEDTTSYNCATYVWQALKYAADLDVDANGGQMVLPADILNYYMKKGDAILF